MPLLKNREEQKAERLEQEESILNLKKEEQRRMAVQGEALKGRDAMRKEKTPFCEACLFRDYKLAGEDMESGRVREKLPSLSWKDYYGEALFEKVGATQSRKPVGRRMEVVNGMDWKCKRMSHGVSIQEEPVFEER